jgi:hypothetical protein
MAEKVHAGTERLKPYRFAPGVSGNPKGRPRKRPLSGAYEELLAQQAPPEIVAALTRFGIRKGATWAECIAISRVKAALLASGNGTLAAKELREAVEGRSPKRVEFISQEERSVVISVEYEEPRTERPIIEERIPAHRVIEVPAAPAERDAES